MGGHRVQPNYTEGGHLFRVVGNGARLDINGDCPFPADADLRCGKHGETRCNLVQDNVARPEAALVAVQDGGTAVLDRLRIAGNTAATIFSARSSGSSLSATSNLVEDNRVRSSVAEAVQGGSLDTTARN